mmetsp:Transcript_8075/g.23670  ORF Transcript_8075/g.23670 Transcript_8075/m.23670 type:complete len:255 (+) Transcript_8075:1049-1813(+)
MTLLLTHARLPADSKMMWAAIDVLISFDMSSALKSSLPSISRMSVGMLGIARFSPASCKPCSGSCPLASTRKPRGEVRNCCAPCSQPRAMISFSFMFSLISGSALPLERWAMAASLATTFSSRVNSLACSTSSTSSSESGLSSSLSSFVYLKICLQRWRTTFSMRSKGCKATTLMLLLMRSPKTHMMSIMKTIRPIAAAASCCLGAARSKDVCILDLCTSWMEEFLHGLEKSEASLRSSTSGLQLKIPSSPFSP